MSPSSLLYRQISPSWLAADGTSTSQAFRPTPKDEGLLSSYDGDLISPKEAWIFHTTQLAALVGKEGQFASLGIQALSRQELTAEKLPVIEDRQPFPEHLSIDFRDLTKKDVERIAQRLKAAAHARGWLFRGA